MPQFIPKIADLAAHMPVQGLQHRTVAAEHDQDLGMDRIGLAVARLELRQGGLGLG